MALTPSPNPFPNPKRRKETGTCGPDFPGKNRLMVE
jgi:hypothetical protein